MRIGIDASRALLAQRTGTENYSLQLINHLIELAEHDARDIEFTLYCPQQPADGLFTESSNWKAKVIPFPRLWTHIRLSGEMLVSRPDVLFVPGHVLPYIHPKESVVTVHDVGHLYYPETYPKNMLRYMTWATKHNIEKSKHLLADSEATKADIIRHFSIDPERITVVYPGVSLPFQPKHSATAIQAVQERYGIRPPYVLYVGTLHPRKNVERLLEAFAKAKQRGLQEHLVIAGRLGWLPEGILRRLRDIDEGVTLAGYVPDTDLPLLYAGATLFVLPSLFEGFGMPILEAMACGAPVLAADTSSLPEVVGDAGAFFDPHNVDQLAESMTWLCQHPQELDVFRARGFVRADDFTWEEAARKTLGVLRAAAS